MEGTTADKRAGTDLGPLRARFRGALIAPGEGGWDEARQAFNLLLDQRPIVVAFPADEEDVASTVHYARERGLRVASRRTGHGADPLGSLEGTILLRTDAMQGVEIDTEARRARVRAGAKWENLVPDASELGLAALHGSSPSVGIVGYTLSGGMGWYARRHGFAANSVIAVELVTADGQLRRVDHDHEPELFWAVRGGGGNFGVITTLEFELFPITEVYAGVLFFPWERSSEVLHAWNEWLPGVPDELTSFGRILQFPPLPMIPEPLRGNSFALVEAAYLGSEADGAELMRPLRDLGPAMDTFAMVPPVGLAEMHMDPPDPVPVVGDHQLLKSLPAKAIDDLVAVAGPDSGSPLLSLEIRHLEGALARSEPHHGALSTIPGMFATFAVGLAVDAESNAALQAQLLLVKGALESYDAGRYWNFTLEQLAAERFFPGETCRRLSAVKAQYDPEDTFQANQPIASPG
jgi:hypothetical protein